MGEHWLIEIVQCVFVLATIVKNTNLGREIFNYFQRFQIKFICFIF